jgi:hypothetical protein
MTMCSTQAHRADNNADRYRSIGKLRNRVVHKEGYRPRLDEVEAALTETRKLIFGLHYGLGVQ